MKVKTIASIGLVVLGVATLLLSGYIAREVAAGRLQIMQGQKQIDTVDSVFSMSRYTKPFGKQLTGAGQKRIDAGEAEADKYERVSNQLRIGGIILIVLGGGLFFYWKRRD